LQHLEPLRSSRGLVLVRKQGRKLLLVDRLELWLSTSRKVDGLWIGTREDKPWPGLSRVEEALRLIKHNDPLHYSRILKNLDRIWVSLIPSARAHYDGSLNACVFDERYLLLETMTIEAIASAIVHEATHARLERYGVVYDEKRRSRIEAICLRRERNFLTRLPHSEPFQSEIAHSLEWYADNHDYFSDASFRQREDQGQVETLRYIGAPDWFINFLMYIVRRRRLHASRQSGP
jgi:hypothetical protein